MKKFATFIAAASLAAVSGSASAWWGDRWGNNGWGDGLTDGYGDVDGGFSMSFSGRGSGRGSVGNVHDPAQTGLMRDKSGEHVGKLAPGKDQQPTVGRRGAKESQLLLLSHWPRRALEKKPGIIAQNWRLF